MEGYQRKVRRREGREGRKKGEGGRKKGKIWVDGRRVGRRE